nr:uncharacterized protein LOC109168224 [Ipomoea batatas]
MTTTSPIPVVNHLNAPTHFPIRLTESNFPVWQCQVKLTLIGHDLYGYIDGTTKAPSKFVDATNIALTSEYTVWYRQDRIIVGALLESYWETIQPLISSTETASEAWSWLSTSYASDSKKCIIYLKFKLINNTKGIRTTAEYLSDMRKISDALAAAKSPVSENDLIAYVLSQLEDDYRSIVPAIQSQYITNILSSFHTDSAKSVTTPMSTSIPLTATDSATVANATRFRKLISLLRHLGLTRPDVALVVNWLSQFMHAPETYHWVVVKCLLRYLKGSLHHGLFLRSGTPLVLTAFSDANWSGNCDYGRSTTAFKPTRHKTVSHSSTEDEYRALANATVELVWVQNLLCELGVPVPKAPHISSRDQAVDVLLSLWDEICFFIFAPRLESLMDPPSCRGIL